MKNKELAAPFLDLAAINARFPLADAAARVIAGGRFVLGDELAAFEEEFARHCGAAHCVGVGNGLDALHIMLRAAMAGGDLRAGDEVLISANTYIATALAVSAAGLCPVPVEPNEATHNICPQAAARAAARHERARAVLATHLYGQCANMEALRALCRQRGWLLFDDAAQAHGARAAGGRAGTLADATAFSFYPSKNLGALGDGGAIVCDDDALAKTARALRNYGSEKKYINRLPGFNSRLDDMQAAFLRAKLPLLDSDNARRRQIAARYIAKIKHPAVCPPAAPARAESHVWHLFVVCCEARDALAAHLQGRGVQTAIHYPVPPHKQGAYANTPLAQYKLPKAERLANEVLSLPISPTLTDEQAERVIAAVNDFPAP